MTEFYKGEFIDGFDKVNAIFEKIANTTSFDLRIEHMNDAIHILEYMRGFATGLLYSDGITTGEYKECVESIFKERKNIVARTFESSVKNET